MGPARTTTASQLLPTHHQACRPPPVCPAGDVPCSWRTCICTWHPRWVGVWVVRGVIKGASAGVYGEGSWVTVDLCPDPEYRKDVNEPLPQLVLSGSTAADLHLRTCSSSSANSLKGSVLTMLQHNHLHLHPPQQLPTQQHGSSPSCKLRRLIGAEAPIALGTYGTPGQTNAMPGALAGSAVSGQVRASGLPLTASATIVQPFCVLIHALRCCLQGRMWDWVEPLTALHLPNHSGVTRLGDIHCDQWAAVAAAAC
jgi:hypothetical protein